MVKAMTDFFECLNYWKINIQSLYNIFSLSKHMVMLIDENFVENCPSYEYKSYTLIVCLKKKKVIQILIFFIVFVSHTSA